MRIVNAVRTTLPKINLTNNVISYQFERFYHYVATETFALACLVIELASVSNELCLSDCYRMEGCMFNESGQPTRAVESNRLAQKYTLLAIAKGYIGEDD